MKTPLEVLQMYVKNEGYKHIQDWLTYEPTRRQEEVILLAMESYAQLSVYEDQELRKASNSTFWEDRCEAAENYIYEITPDHSTTTKQIKAYNEWMDLKNNKTERNDEK